jgi:hypothetical protein
MSGALVFGIGAGLGALEADFNGDLVGDLVRIPRDWDLEGVKSFLLTPGSPGFVVGVWGKADARRGVPLMACCGCQS